MNEPELKLAAEPYPSVFCKVLVSAFDAVLDAEREVGVVGPPLNITATFSFAVCHLCPSFADKPGLGQMAVLRRAMQMPEEVGYKARNDLWAAYQRRFVNSVNTESPSEEFQRLFLRDYDSHAAFQGVPVFIGEYHSPVRAVQRQDLGEILEAAANASSLLTGICFFEFQVRYDKGGNGRGEMSYGMFGLGTLPATTVNVRGTNFTGWCLTPVADMLDPQTLVPAAVAEAFGGRGVDPWQLCPAT